VFEDAARDWGRDFRVLVPSMPGWLDTPAAPREDYLPSALARRVETLAGDDPFFVVGFSWGGTIGLRIAPDRLRGLVLVDVGYQSYPDATSTYEELLAEYGDADFAPPEAVAGGFWGVGTEPAHDALHKVREVPILLLVATEPEVERRRSDVDAFREALPHADVQVIEGAEHNVLQTAPDEAIPLIGAWLRRVAAGAG
jgi:pimeloyl-ACP methyl ester carboxylesterase